MKNKIREFILPGTIIVSDGWAAYRHISDIDGGIFEHEVVIHERNFVNPHNRQIHTQNVENMWMRAKRKLRRQFGTSEALFYYYLHEFLCRNSARGNPAHFFSYFLTCIAETHPLY